MRNFFLLATLGVLIMQRALPDELQAEALLKICRKGTPQEVQQALKTTPATYEALNAVLERGNVEIANLFLSDSITLYIQRKWFTRYCLPGKTSIALWLLKHGNGPYYQPSKKS